MKIRTHRRIALAATTAAVMAVSPLASARRIPMPPRYEQVVADVSNMVSDGDAREKVDARGLDLVNVMWEDTGRWEGSSVGPNISDVTIEVEASRHGDDRKTYLMPVIRNDNFS